MGSGGSDPYAGSERVIRRRVWLSGGDQRRWEGFVTRCAVHIRRLGKEAREERHGKEGGYRVFDMVCGCLKMF